MLTNKTENDKVILEPSQAPKNKRLTQTQFKAAKALRLKQVATMLRTTYIRVFLAAKKLDIPFKLVATGERGRPPIEVAKTAFKQIASHLEVENPTFAPEKKAKTVVDASDAIVVPEPTTEVTTPAE